jgi:hypothetical protein
LLVAYPLLYFFEDFVMLISYALRFFLCNGTVALPQELNSSLPFLLFFFINSLVGIKYCLLFHCCFSFTKKNCFTAFACTYHNSDFKRLTLATAFCLTCSSRVTKFYLALVPVFAKHAKHAKQTTHSSIEDRRMKGELFSIEKSA